jgi:hypothetical protein
MRDYKQKTDGTITVFLSLILLLILSLLFTVIEGARVSTAKVYADRALSTAMDSVLAEYYGPLWEEYHIFGLNMGNGTDTEKKELLNQKISDYMSYTFEPGKNLNNTYRDGKSELYDISIDSLSAGSETMLMDYQGELLINESVEYMKYREMGDAVELLLDKMNLLESPEKVSYVYEEKQKVEQELVEIDKGILELMKLLDGVMTNSNGIELTKKGALKVADYFVKKIYFGQVTKEAVGINQDTIFQALKDSYIDPTSEFDKIKMNFTNLDQILVRVEEIQAELAAANINLSEEQAELDSLNAIEDKTKDVKQQIKAIKKTIETIETNIDDLNKEAKEQEELKKPLIASITTSKNTLLSLISNIKTRIDDALIAIDKIVTKKEAAEPLLEGYEEFLYSQKESISEDVFAGLEENLNELKRYTSKEEGSYDFEGMKSILGSDMAVLTQAEAILSQGEAELSQELYQSSRATYDSAEQTLNTYQIAGLTLDYSTLVFDNAEKQDPLGSANNLIQAGITSMVLDPGTISDAELTQETLPSEIAVLSQENTDFFAKISSFFGSASIGGDSSGLGSLFGSFGDGSQLLNMAGDGINALAEHFLYQEYLKEHFGMFPMAGEDTTLRKPSALVYEQEYLLIGKTSDMDNLSSVISRILFLRTVLDFVSILGDSAKRNEAKLVATSLVGFIGLPILVSITQVLILLIWSFAEALLDVCALMMGKEVPILKKNISLEFPELFLINRSFLQTKASSLADTKELSLSYHDYLRVFLLLKSKEDLCYRSLDLMQENIRIRYGEDTFQIQNCLYGFDAEAEFTVASKFTGISFVQKYLGQNPDGYRFLTKAVYSY